MPVWLPVMPRDYQFPYELRHLIYFREVARQLHFRKAAETLAVTQPSLSRQINQLEKALGHDLLNRHQRKVEITPAGRLLLERIEPILRGLSHLPEELRAVADGQLGHLRVSFTGLAMATVLPGILREFHRKHPGIKLELTESPTAAQLKALQSDEIACGFFHPDPTTPGLKTLTLLREKNGVLLPSDHALARKRKLHLRDLAATPFVLFPRAHNPGFYDRVLTAFASVGVTPRIAEEVWPRANAIGLVRAGLGATFMCASEARQLPPEVRFCPLEGPAPESRLVIGWRAASEAAKAPEPALAAFLAIVTQHAAATA